MMPAKTGEATKDYRVKTGRDKFKAPVGEVYVETENPRGVLGFYLESQGGPSPTVARPARRRSAISPSPAKSARTSCWRTSRRSSAPSMSSWARWIGKRVRERQPATSDDSRLAPRSQSGLLTSAIILSPAEFVSSHFIYFPVSVLRPHILSCSALRADAKRRTPHPRILSHRTITDAKSCGKMHHFTSTLAPTWCPHYPGRPPDNVT